MTIKGFLGTLLFFVSYLLENEKNYEIERKSPDIPYIFR